MQRCRLNHIAGLIAAVLVALALAAVVNSTPAEAAPSGGIDSPDGAADYRRYGNAEGASSPKLDEHLLLLTGDDVLDVDQDDSGHDRRDGEEDDGVRKRRWGQNKLALWGKRRLPYGDEDDDTVAAIKRKWGQKNMALWGKRSSGRYEVDDTASTADKRKWGQKNMALWGRK